MYVRTDRVAASDKSREVKYHNNINTWVKIIINERIFEMHNYCTI